MTNRWTPERRARQAEMIRRWKPWERSTGPTTDAGKLVASRNAMQHGMRSARSREERRHMIGMLRDCSDWLGTVRDPGSRH